MFHRENESFAGLENNLRAHYRLCGLHNEFFAPTLRFLQPFSNLHVLKVQIRLSNSSFDET